MGFKWWGPHDGISLSSFFSLLPLPPPGSHITYENIVRRELMQIRVSSPGTQLPTTLILHSLQAMTICGTKSSFVVIDAK